jgi:flagellar assembly factor FliW
MLQAAFAPSTVPPAREPVATPALVDAGQRLTTRFGPVAVDPARLITVPAGLFGFAHRSRFVLTALPGREAPFKLFQSVDDPDLGFLVLPLDAARGPIARADLEAAAAKLGIPMEALVALAIVTLRAMPNDLRCTINLKAPILIDSGRQIGAQHVLANDAYEVRQPLALAAGASDAA